MGIEIILKMLLAAVLGGIIGLEREISHKETGLRVNVLMTVGCTLLTVLAMTLTGNGQNNETATLPGSPMLAHIITALGIIGAGVIVRERFTLHGLTSAATIWIVGAIGITIGTGYYMAAFGITLFIIATLTLLKKVTAILEKQGKLYAYIISTEERASIILDIKKIVIELGLKYINANMRKTRDGYQIEMALHTSQTKNKEFVERIMQLPDVIEINSENL
ncbi:MAG: MgtC/SapB family protein [bacterium]|nr:MgtC/SapB family protein [bacterium]